MMCKGHIRELLMPYESSKARAEQAKWLVSRLDAGQEPAILTICRLYIKPVGLSVENKNELVDTPSVYHESLRNSEQSFKASILTIPPSGTIFHSLSFLHVPHRARAAYLIRVVGYVFHALDQE